MTATGQPRRFRLDRFISSRAGVNRRDVRALLASGRVCLNGRAAREINQVVDQFSHITLDDEVLQDYAPMYLMLHKPRGVVSATRNEKHRTVIDLLDANMGRGLHIAGRLDYNSTGLLLLTNDGRWSRRLACTHNPVQKVYRVTVEHALTERYVEAFEQGMYFPFEDITTRPVSLTILSDRSAELRLTEGRYHQIKRLFGRFDNKVLTLHRSAIGNVALEPELGPGQHRALTRIELDGLGNMGSEPKPPQAVR
jgi:16S rRNA pseudouridine516 synthase